MILVLKSYDVTLLLCSSQSYRRIDLSGHQAEISPGICQPIVPKDESSHIWYFRETPLRSFNGANLNRGQLGMLRRVSDRYRDVNVSNSWELGDCQKSLKSNKGS